MDWVLQDTCPDEHLLMEMLQGELEGEELRALDEHLDRCPMCAELIMDLAPLYVDVGEDDTEEIPAFSVAAPGGARQVNRYFLLRQVGIGGMGIVYEAYDDALDRKVAIKLLRTDLIDPSNWDECSSRLLREARLLASISHPHVLTVHDAGLWEEQIFMAVQFVEGSNLSQWIRQEKPSWRKIVEIYLKAGEGLAEAHRCGLVHRDFKPENILIGGGGGVWLTDFGLACAIGRQVKVVERRGEEEKDLWVSTITQTGAIMGTPAYMSPEQFRGGGEVNEKSDQFSFCASVFESLYGERAFLGESLLSFEEEVLQGKIKAAPREDIPTKLYQVLTRGMSLDPKARHGSMDELLMELRACVEPRRWVPWYAGGAAALALLGSLSVLSSAGVFQEPEVPEPRIVKVQERTAKDPCIEGEKGACETWSRDLLNELYNDDGEQFKSGLQPVFHARVDGARAAVEKSCDEGGPHSCMVAGLMVTSWDVNGILPSSNLIPIFFSWMEKGCKLGEARACAMIRDVYGDGLYKDEGTYAIPVDVEKMVEILAPSCHKGNGKVCWILAEQYYTNAALEKPLSQVLDFLEGACEDGRMEACFYLGHALLDQSQEECFNSMKPLLSYLRWSFILTQSSYSSEVRDYCRFVEPAKDEERALKAFKKGCSIGQKNRNGTLYEGLSSCVVGERLEAKLRAERFLRLRTSCKAGEKKSCYEFADEVLKIAYDKDHEGIRRNEKEWFRKAVDGMFDHFGETCADHHVFSEIWDVSSKLHTGGKKLTTRPEGKACVLAAFAKVAMVSEDLEPEGEALPVFSTLMELGCVMGEPIACVFVRDLYGDAYYDTDDLHPVQKDLHKMGMIMLTPCKMGVGEICWQVADYYAREREFSTAVKLAEKACDEGDYPFGCFAAGFAWWHTSPTFCQQGIMEASHDVDRNAVADFLLYDEEAMETCHSYAAYQDNEKALDFLRRGCDASEKWEDGSSEKSAAKGACLLLPWVERSRKLVDLKAP